MDGARLSLFPHHAWLAFHVLPPADGRPLVYPWHSVAHGIGYVIAGDHRLSWAEHGRDYAIDRSAGAAHFFPADDIRRDFLIEAASPYDIFLLVIPRRHLAESAAADGIVAPESLRQIYAPNDHCLRTCLSRLADPTDDDHGGGSLRRDDAARRLLLRLLELHGLRPDWHDDASIFDRRTLEHLVDYIDAHLTLVPSLDEFAQRVGLSPNHFARKFRQSTGTSLHRFVNRRRLRASFALLADQSLPIAAVASELGFASQSHFTRIFGNLTGMTPARFRHCCSPSPWRG